MFIIKSYRAAILQYTHQFQLKFGFKFMLINCLRDYHVDLLSIVVSYDRGSQRHIDING